MENFENVNPDLLSSNSLEIDEQSGSHLKDAGIWARAIAIIASVILGLVMTGILLFGSGLGRRPGYAGGYFVGLTIGAFIVIGIALIGIINLFRFSSGMAAGISNQDAAAFDKGITGLKTYFILIGVLTLLLTFITIIQLIS